jgi:DNA repair protein RadA/Sms
MKETKRYSCKSCGHNEGKWLGRCPSCGAWNSFVEVESEKKSVRKDERSEVEPVPISAIKIEEEQRYDSGIEELNRVLGGGIIKGASILVGGEPGIGKSTLMLELAHKIVSPGRVLYVSGEESKTQIKMRATRLGINSERIEVLNDTSVAHIIRAIDNVKPILIIVDSIQTVHSETSDSGAGSVSQVKHSTFELNEHVKARSSSIVFIGHVTKEGVIAGPKIVEHIVDTVLYFDETDTDIRILRAVKNRFGATHEIGIFRMCETGLEQVKNPQSLFIEHRDGNPPPGVAIVPVFEGSRVLMVEIQSLVVPAKGGISRILRQSGFAEGLASGCGSRKARETSLRGPRRIREYRRRLEDF